MKSLCGLLTAVALLGWAIIHLGGCSLINKPCADPMSCNCPTSPNPACAPWPDDNGDNPSTMAKRNRPDGGTR
jgi:hypothetical protein